MKQAIFYSLKVYATVVVLTPLLMFARRLYYAEKDYRPWYGVSQSETASHLALLACKQLLGGSIFLIPVGLAFSGAVYFLMRKTSVTKRLKLYLSGVALLLTSLPYILLISQMSDPNREAAHIVTIIFEWDLGFSVLVAISAVWFYKISTKRDTPQS